MLNIFQEFEGQVGSGVGCKATRGLFMAEERYHLAPGCSAQTMVEAAQTRHTGGCWCTSHLTGNTPLRAGEAVRLREQAEPQQCGGGGHSERHPLWRGLQERCGPRNAQGSQDACKYRIPCGREEAL